MNTNKIIFNIITLLETNTNWELQSSASDVVTYKTARCPGHTFFAEEDGSIFSTTFGEFDNFKHFETVMSAIFAMNPGKKLI